jgi:hypothetical protein
MELLTSLALPIPGIVKVEMDRRADRRKRAVFTIGYIVFLGIVTLTLLWALNLL